MDTGLGNMGKKHQFVRRKSGYQQTSHFSPGLINTLVGDGPAMRRIYEFLDRVGPCDSTVLIQGESGTGKELAARALHRKSRRGDLPECVLAQPALINSKHSKFHSAVQTLKKSLILQAMHESQGNCTHAAKNLGLHANYLHRLIRNLGLRSSVRMFSSQPEPEVSAAAAGG